MDLTKEELKQLKATIAKLLKAKAVRRRLPWALSGQADPGHQPGTDADGLWPWEQGQSNAHVTINTDMFRVCFWQLHLVHFGILIWPTLSD
jgi:hypothetical protein